MTKTTANTVETIEPELNESEKNSPGHKVLWLLCGRLEEQVIFLSVLDSIICLFY